MLFCIDLSHGRRRPLAAWFLILIRLEFTVHNVARVDLDIVVPLLWQIGLREDCRHRTDRYTGTAINALSRIDIQLRHFVVRRAAIVIGSALRRMDAIHWAHVYTGGVLRSDARFCDDVRHRSTPAGRIFPL